MARRLAGCNCYEEDDMAPLPERRKPVRPLHSGWAGTPLPEEKKPAKKTAKKTAAKKTSAKKTSR